MCAFRQASQKVIDHGGKLLIAMFCFLFDLIYALHSPSLLVSHCHYLLCFAVAFVVVAVAVALSILLFALLVCVSLAASIASLGCFAT